MSKIIIFHFRLHSIYVTYNTYTKGEENMHKFSFKNVIKWVVVLFVVYMLANVITDGKIEQIICNYISGNKTLEDLEDPVDNGFEKAVVVSVTDGDTITVKVSGKEFKVRMIGVNTPESVHADASKNTAEGTEASNYTKSQLKPGTTVYLEYDMDKEDDYGRTLAYIWLEDDCDTSDYEDFCKYNYGAILLQNTYCEAVYYAPNGMYREWYEQLDAEN